MHEPILRGLKEIPFLSEVPAGALDTLALRAKRNTFPKHSLLINEGDETTSLYILLSGKVRVYTSDDSGREITLQTLLPVSYFGELALFTNEPRSASVMTAEKSSCAVISRTDFKHWLIDHPEVAFRLIGDLAVSVKRLTDKVKQLALLNVYERTILALQEMAIKEENVYVIHNRPTQQELACLVGASREMINKIMKELTKGGYISIGNKTLTIERKLPTSW